MNCTEVVNSFTEYLDGSVSECEATAIDAHLEGCRSCVRYRNVLVHGSEVLRSLPRPELREDFEPRLQHRLYHVDDDRLLGAHAASGAPAMTVLGIAIMLTAVAWSPTLFTGSANRDVPASVARTTERTAPRPASPPGTFSSKSPDGADGIFEGEELWPYTELSQRYDQRGRELGFSLADR